MANEHVENPRSNGFVPSWLVLIAGELAAALAVVLALLHVWGAVQVGDLAVGVGLALGAGVSLFAAKTAHESARAA